MADRFDQNIEGIYYMCGLSNDCHHHSIWIVATLTVIDYDFHFTDLFVTAIVLFMKRKDDVLMMFNRLGDLVKISIFQKYKDPKLRLYCSQSDIATLMKDRIRGLPEQTMASE